MTALECIAERWRNKTLASNELTVGFKPIEGLKPGDRVIYEGSGALKCPRKGDVGTVCRVFNPPVEQTNGGGPVIVKDFTMLLVDEDGDVMEFGFDSRYFKRKEA